MKNLVLVSLFLSSVAATAGIPDGFYSGSVYNSNQEYCQLNNAEIAFSDSGMGGYSVRWEERGIYYGGGTGFCENVFDADFSASVRPNEWDVTFRSANDLNFGRATLRGNSLRVVADFGFGAYTRFDARLDFDEGSRTARYQRRVDLVDGRSHFANGVLSH